MNLEQRKYLWSLKYQFHKADFYEPYESIWGNYNKADGKYYSWRVTSKGHDFINHHFYECTQVYEIDMDKAWFIAYIKQEPNRYDSPWRSTKTNRRVYRWRYKNPYGLGYVRQPHHKKKELSEHELARREWRDKKGIAKDNAKAYYRRGAGKYFKRLSNKLHRAWSKDNIKHHRTSMSDTDYKLFLDPWMWD